MNGKGDAIMGIGVASGDNRAVEAATQAINNPLLEDAHIDGARGILVSVAGGETLSLTEYEEIIRIITANADEDALIKTGMIIDPALEDRIAVTVIATGFNTMKHLKKKEERDTSKDADIISYKEWMSMSEAHQGQSANEYLLSRNPKEHELWVPTVLRSKKASGQSEL